jgi:hypothetical protein
VPLVASPSWSWRLAMVIELISCYRQKQGQQWPPHRTLPSHIFRVHESYMLDWKVMLQLLRLFS